MWLSLDTYAQIHPLNGNTTSKALAQEDSSPWQAAEMVQEWHEESEGELIAWTWPPNSPDPDVMEASLRSTEPPLWIGLCSDRLIHRIFKGIPLWWLILCQVHVCVASMHVSCGHLCKVCDHKTSSNYLTLARIITQSVGAKDQATLQCMV